MCVDICLSMVNPCEFMLIKRVQKEAEGLNPLNIDNLQAGKYHSRMADRTGEVQLENRA